MKKTLTLRKTIVIIILVVCAFALVKQQFSMYRVKNQIEESEKTLSELQKQNAMLKAELEEAKNQTDEYLEQLARERLGMVKPGEQVINFDKSE